MAFGIADNAGVMDRPVTDSDVGLADWGQLSGISPAHPLVGGTAGTPGFGSVATRQVAVSGANAAAPQAQAARANWSELFNYRGNPLGWVLIAAIAYLALTHLHFRAGAGVSYRGKK